MRGWVHIQEATRVTHCISRLKEHHVTVSVHAEGASGQPTPVQDVSTEKTRKEGFLDLTDEAPGPRVP